MKKVKLLKNMDYKRPSLVFCLDKEALPIGAKLSALLRKQGQNVIFHSKAAKIKKAFKLTENYKVRTLFLLNQDAQKGLVSVRDADSKEEKQISIQSLEEA